MTLLDEFTPVREVITDWARRGAHFVEDGWIWDKSACPKCQGMVFCMERVSHVNAAGYLGGSLFQCMRCRKSFYIVVDISFVPLPPKTHTEENLS